MVTKGGTAVTRRAVVGVSPKGERNESDTKARQVSSTGT